MRKTVSMLKTRHLDGCRARRCCPLAHTPRHSKQDAHAAELEHVAMLGTPTIGFPSMMRNLGWVRDVTQKTGLSHVVLQQFQHQPSSPLIRLRRRSKCFVRRSNRSIANKLHGNKAMGSRAGDGCHPRSPKPELRCQRDGWVCVCDWKICVAGEIKVAGEIHIGQPPQEMPIGKSPAGRHRRTSSNRCSCGHQARRCNRTHRLGRTLRATDPIAQVRYEHPSGRREHEAR